MEIHEFNQFILQGAGPQRSGFLSAFFALVGAHGAHVACGMLWMAAMLVQLATKGLTAPVQSRLLRLGMFWHCLRYRLDRSLYCRLSDGGLVR